MYIVMIIINNPNYNFNQIINNYDFSPIWKSPSFSFGSGQLLITHNILLKWTFFISYFWLFFLLAVVLTAQMTQFTFFKSILQNYEDFPPQSKKNVCMSGW